MTKFIQIPQETALKNDGSLVDFISQGKGIISFSYRITVDGKYVTDAINIEFFPDIFTALSLSGWDITPIDLEDSDLI